MLDFDDESDVYEGHMRPVTGHMSSPSHFDADMLRLRDTIEDRRAIAVAQQATDAIKSQICDKIRVERDAISPTLAKQIAALEHTDADLFKYIRRLEFIQDGIWCNKCNSIKNVEAFGIRSNNKTNTKHTLSASEATVTGPQSEHILMDEVRKAQQQVTMIRQEIQDRARRIDAIESSILSIQQRMHALYMSALPAATASGAVGMSHEYTVSDQTTNNGSCSGPQCKAEPSIIDIQLSELPVPDLSEIACIPEEVGADDLLND